MGENRIIRKREMHGFAGTSIYNIWCSMKSRCHNPNSTKYPNYGARGIVVCYRWRRSFEDFLEDMGLPENDMLQLDRIKLGHYKSPVQKYEKN